MLSAISQLVLLGTTVAGALFPPRRELRKMQLTQERAELSQPFQESFLGHSDLAVTSLCELSPLFRTAPRSLTPHGQGYTSRPLSSHSR